MARDFNTIKSELIELSKQYYPELTDSLNDASVGSWIVDLVAAVGDDLNYYIDRCYNEQNANTAALKSSVLNMARMNNFKVPGPKAAMCEVAISVDLPHNGAKDSMSKPNWDFAPKIKQGAIVTNGNVEFEIVEDVDFGEQFNADAVSNRKFVPLKNARGALCGYRVTKTVLASAGRTRLYKKLLTESDIKPYMEVIIPFKNVMNVEGVLFKETQNLAIQPETFEFYIDAEKFTVGQQTINTYKYFEVNSLSDQYRFGTVNDLNQNQIQIYPSQITLNQNESNEETKELDLYYKGAWLPVLQKYITEYTDNGYLKLIFGSGVECTSLEDSTDATVYAQHQLTKIANNELTGILPKSNWVMYVLYRDGGGVNANVSPNSINQMGSSEWEFPRETTDNKIDPNQKAQIKKSVRVTNISQGIAGSDAPSVADIKALIRYNNSAQERCVTLKDYELRVKMMDPKFGAPYKCKAIEDNNKILIYMLGLSNKGELINTTASTMKNNIVAYLEHYKTLGDFVELRSGLIFNIKIHVYASIDKTYNKQSVVKNIINTVDDFFDTQKHEMGEDIYISELEKEISSIDGLLNLEKIYIDSCVNGNYSSTWAPLPMMSDLNLGSNIRRIDLDVSNKTLTCDARGMFEIKDKSSDIIVHIRTI